MCLCTRRYFSGRNEDQFDLIDLIDWLIDRLMIWYDMIWYRVFSEGVASRAVWRRLTNSIGFVVKHLRWVLHKLNDIYRHLNSPGTEPFQLPLSRGFRPNLRKLRGKCPRIEALASRTPAVNPLKSGDWKSSIPGLIEMSQGYSSDGNWQQGHKC
jgi:hypothetical protein